MNKRLNNKYISIIWMISLHLAILTFDFKKVCILDAFIFIAMIATKLFIYSRFMDS